ncbi:MAG TPA: hydantoinase/oxoprolinase family protein [Candidatus Binataceae bacterium]|nr:hydantoinase/oxoprolinase family protein [Candidatus Binataceae bacterium]
MNQYLVGIDCGGTFTDLVAVEAASGRIFVTKVPSTPDDPSRAVIAALDELFAAGVDPSEVQFLAHGTTVATNAILEGKGVRAGLLITRGFRAIYEARGWIRPESIRALLDPFFQKPPMLVSQELTGEIRERIDSTGAVLTALDEAEVRAAVRRLREQGVTAIAVCYLFSFLNGAHEERTVAIIAEEAPGIRVSLSSRVLPAIREYPRLSTTVVDAYVGPVMERYLVELGERLRRRGITTPQVYLMQSNGGLMRMNVGARYPTQTLLSGPSAGVVGGIEVAANSGVSHIVTFDMGGTSTDIGVVAAGRAEQSSEGQLAGQDIGIPMLKIRTLGAGGGTIAYVGPDGLLKVGPQSAGAVPGPACYGRGGIAPTVTDANLMLGALGSRSLLGGRMVLDDAAARAAIERLAALLKLDPLETAAGIIRIVNNNMAINLRLALYDQGQDPRRFALVAFGGAGPIHATYLARELHIPQVLIPARPGLLSAAGLLDASVRHIYLRSAVGLLDSFPLARIQEIFQALIAQALADAHEEGIPQSALALRREIDLRYQHQGYQLAVTCPGRELADADRDALRRDFDSIHQRLYGQSAPQEPAEIVTFRLVSEMTRPPIATAPLPRADGSPVARALAGERQLFSPYTAGFLTARIYERAKLLDGDEIAGPAIVEQFDSTSVIWPGQRARVDRFGTLIVETGATQ